MSDIGGPVLTGYVGHRLRGSRDHCALMIWCRWCVNWHQHGVPCDVEDGRRTSRVSHCYADDWGRRERRYEGYEIRVSDVPFEAVEKTVQVATATQQRVIREGRTTPAIERLRAQVPHVPSRRKVRAA